MKDPADTPTRSYSCRRSRKVAVFLGAIGLLAALILFPTYKQSNVISTTIAKASAGHLEDKRDAKVYASRRKDNKRHNKPETIRRVHDTCPNISDIVYCPNNKDPTAISLYCRDCLDNDEPLVSIYYYTNISATKPSMQSGHKIYLPIITPPFFGSSALSNILSSSPTTTNMCKDPYSGRRIPWQCESTSTLVKEGIIIKKTRWDPLGTNWTEAYAGYERLRVWRDMDAPIRIDKAPPNIAKTRQLVEYFESNGMDYRFVVMMRHPCRKDWKHPKYETERYSKYLQEIVEYIPEGKRFLINYDDLVTRPGTVLRALLDWFPLLTSLSIDSNELKPNKKGKPRQRGSEAERLRDGARRLRGAKEGGSLQAYIDSNKCVLSLRADFNATPPEEIMLWDQNFANDRLQY